jgi:hypothetical protein
MAREADVVALGDQHFGGIALVRMVAGTASAVSDRGMKVLLADEGVLVVAEEAELFTGGPELKSVRRLMGVVALVAETVSHRGMDEILHVSPAVALMAETPHVLDGFEFVLSDGLVAERAVARRRRAVHVRLLAHPGMALVCNTGGVCGRLGEEGAAAVRQNKRQAEGDDKGKHIPERVSGSVHKDLPDVHWIKIQKKRKKIIHYAASSPPPGVTFALSRKSASSFAF